jgi:hypothetical protein
MDHKDKVKEARIRLVKQAWRGNTQARATIDVVIQLPDELRALFWDILVTAGSPTTAAHQLHAYLQAGAPYGTSSEGFQRWINEE